ncbi:MAG: GAF domain-containing protein [Chroococcus sp. CMT-3BRIN-NPC107]|jgi:twitching motility protein PilJ|nr:GAF domain-containing protein [Chroococcus sp. CMT-3BRIN-NPC107]
MNTKFDPQSSFEQPPDARNNSKILNNKLTPLQNNNVTQQTKAKSKKGLSLKKKATILAIALSVLPVILIGAIATYVTTEKITENLQQQQKARTIALSNQINQFIVQQYRDIQTLSQLSILNNPTTSYATSNRAKQAILDRYIKDNPVYDSIAVIDLEGKVILQSAGSTIANYNEINYFQEVLRTNRPVITPPRKSSGTGEYSIFVAAPVVNNRTGETIAIVRSRTPLKYFNNIIQAEAKQLTQSIDGYVSEEYYAINDIGKVVVAPTRHTDYIGRDAQTIFPIVAEQLSTARSVGSVVEKDLLEQKWYLVSYTPVGKLAEVSQLNWSVLVSQDEDAIFATRDVSVVTLAVATLAIAALVAAIAAWFVNRALRPVMAATSAVRQLGAGQLNTRLAVNGSDELAVLGANINSMAEQLQILLINQESATAAAQTFTDITLRIRRSLNLDDILKTAVREVRKAIHTERVVIYRFNPDFSGTVVAESVVPGWTQALSQTIDDPCFKEQHIKSYKSGRVRGINDIYNAGLTECHINTLEKFEVKANLVAPILKDKQLLGLLIAHHCSEPRNWQESEINLFTQLAAQIGFALDQANLLAQVEKSRISAEAMFTEQREQKELLENQLVDLLSEVEGATKGDLTVRAEVGSGEIGTVADFFNAIVESLREIVTSVKQATDKVNISISENEGAIRQLAEESIKQNTEIVSTLDSVEQMTVSIQSVADSAGLAAQVARQASSSAQAGETAMERTVFSIMNLRDTIAQTAKKVKNLGEASQQISKVTTLINQIALQTNVLAINASIEASRAGEEGRGFAVVAEEVGELATKAAAATKEIEQVLENIQQQTSEVVRAMQLGSSQVNEGTHLVEDTKQSLAEILQVSRKIDELVQVISRSTVSQAKTAQAVTQLMKGLAINSEETASSSRQVSKSLKRTVEVAQQLQTSVGRFKVRKD